MKYAVHLSTQARLDIRNSFNYLTENNPDYAYKWVAEIHDAIQSLQTLPLGGTEFTKATHKDTPIRQLIQKRHQIYYRVRDDMVIISYVHHISQRPIGEE